MTVVSPALSGSLATRKRTIDDVTDSDLPYPLQLATGTSSVNAASIPPPSSPCGVYSRRKTSNLASPPAALTYHTVEELANDASTSYSFSGATASPQLTQAWGTPHSSATALGQEGGLLPLDLAVLSPAAPNPFSISFGTPSSSNAPLDSAYLPAFAYPMTGDSGVPVSSPSQFDLSDLPFSGMDFLQSLGGSVHDTSAAEQNDALWAQLGNSPFKLAPELPFGVIDGNTS